MPRLISYFLASLALVSSLPAAAPVLAPRGPTPVFQAQLQNFEEASYVREVERLIAQYEAQSGRRLVPGAKRKVGLKIYSDSGPGLGTPHGLVKGVIAALEKRGFPKGGIFLVGLNQLRLRWTGFLPAQPNGPGRYDGHPIYVLESGRYYDPSWFYDSPLPQRFDPVFAESQSKEERAETTREEDQKSFLATPLFLESDFWINLPVYTDHRVFGVNGALVNATLWNASNTARFFRSPASAPAAIAEMSAGIPEVRSTWALTIVSLERYQFIDGPYFNSLYTATEPLVWLSADPVILDALMQERMNKWRKKNNFPVIAESIETLHFAEQMGMGSTRTGEVKIVQVGE